MINQLIDTLGDMIAEDAFDGRGVDATTAALNELELEDPGPNDPAPTGVPAAPSCTACGSTVKLDECDGCGTLCLRCAYECPCTSCTAR